MVLKGSAHLKMVERSQSWLNCDPESLLLIYVVMKLKKGYFSFIGTLAFRSVTVMSVCEISALSDDTVSLVMGKPEKTDLVLT